MRIVFVDFDGVLHPSGFPAGTSLPFEWVDDLARLLAPFPEIGVVVHSTWREQFSLDYIQDFLELLGDRSIDVAPRGPKAQAIQQFLREHPDVVDAVILDDQPEQLMQIKTANLRVLACDPTRGISCGRIQAELLEWLQARA